MKNKLTKVLIIFLASLFVSGGSIFAAASTPLSSGVAVTDSIMLRGLVKYQSKAIVLTGTIGDTFTITEDGVSVKTITLAAASEKWIFYHTVNSYKIVFSAPSTDTATLYVSGE